MDAVAFAEAVPALFGGNLRADHPSDRRFRELMDDVAGMASENKLALLNLAARHVGPGEAYLEVGAFRGLSIISAMLGNEGTAFYAIESFRWYGADPRAARTELLANLERWGVRDRLTLVSQDAFRALTRPGWLDQPVGAFFYDGAHDRLAQYVALGMVEPFLAPEALVIVDDTDWGSVAAATDRYMKRRDGYDLLLELSGKRESDPRWWNGLRVYRYRRPVPAPTPAPGVAWRRMLHVWAVEPVTWSVARLARRIVTGRPGLNWAARRVATAVGARMRGRAG